MARLSLLCFCSFSFGNAIINGFKEIDSDLVNESAAHKDDDADCRNLQREVPLGIETHFLGHWENTVPNEHLRKMGCSWSIYTPKQEPAM